MKGRDLLEHVGAIDDKLIDEASEYQLENRRVVSRTKKTKWYFINYGITSGLVACLLCILILAGQSSGGSKNAEVESKAESVLDTAVGAMDETSKGSQNKEESKDMQNSTSSYKQDSITKADYYKLRKEDGAEKEVDIEDGQLEKKGSYYFGEDLNYVLGKYTNNDIQFYVVFDIFADITEETGSNSYGALKLDVNGKALLWEEYNRMLDIGYEVELNENSISGFLTKEQLDHFNANKEYGYVIRLTE